MPTTVTISEGCPFCVRAEALRCGNDLCVAVTGGTLPHVGAVSLAVYEPERDSATVSTMTVYTHRDDVVSAYIAKELSRALKCTVTVSSGIHVDSAGSGDIAQLRENAVACCHALISALACENETGKSETGMGAARNNDTDKNE
jgi:hypothetical protein